MLRPLPILRFVPLLSLLLPLSLPLVSPVYGQEDATKDDAKKDDAVVFKSDVAMTRVDAQVVDREGHAITGLQKEDFVLKVNGKVQPIRNFASENMPIDILLLLDVSGSMGPHVQRIADAAQQALNVLADRDRVAIMIFDTNTRLRLPFKSSHSDVTNELHRIIRSERFNGGTRITRGMLDAAAYVQREARPEARRAIVILTDDETQDEEDEARVEAALDRANAVLSFLRAPYETPNMNPGGGHRRSPGTWGSGGGWPGSGGGIGFPGGGGIGLPGGGGVYSGDRSHTAGTANIANDSGGDVMPVTDASALEDTLERLRQRYALNYYLPEGSNTSDQRTVQLTLSQDARRRYQEADVRYRRVNIAGSSERSGPTVVTHTRAPVEEVPDPATSSDTQPAPKRKRVAVNEDTGGPHTVEPEPQRSPDTEAAPAQAAPPQTDQSQLPKLNSKTPDSKTDKSTSSQGWPRADQSTPQPN